MQFQNPLKAAATLLLSISVLGCSLDARLEDTLSSIISEPIAAPDTSGLTLKFVQETVEFGEVQVGVATSRTVTVINQGTQEAKDLKTWQLNFPFKYLDDAFPGTGGTCGSTLAPGMSCTLVLAFTAQAPASFQANFEIKYDYGDEPHSLSVPLFASADSSIHAVDVKSGVQMFCARLSNNSLKCWGEGGYGKSLGNGVNYSLYDGEPSPVTPLQMSSNVLDFEMTWAYTCALKTGGAVWCWGTFTPGFIWSMNPPHEVIPSGAVKIAIGGATSGCALMDTGLVKCWGDNSSTGIVGIGNTLGSNVAPSDVVGLSGTFVDVAVGESSACALKDNGEVWCWGSNQNGGLAKSSGSIYSSAVQAENMPAGIIEIEAGGSYNNNHCALVDTGVPATPNKVYCWGGTYAAVPVEIVGISGAVKNLKATLSDDQWCVTSQDETHLQCWNDSDHTVRIETFGLGHIVTVAKAGYVDNKCALSQQHVYCWGEHKYGMLGIGGAATRVTVDTEIPGLSNIVDINMDENGYGIDNLGGLFVWGKNSTGAAGTGDTEPVQLPKKIYSSGVSDVATIGYDTCISHNGELLCAGQNYTSSFTKVGSLSNVTELDGYVHFCALAGGAVYCWGWNNSWPLGVTGCSGSCISQPQATQNMTADVTDLSVGYEHSCAIKSGRVYCWGDSASGQLGSPGGSTSVPRLINSADTDFTEVDSGYGASCAARASGGIVCWGAGKGDTTPTLLAGTAGIVATKLNVSVNGDVHYVADGKMYSHNGVTATEMATNWSRYYPFSLMGGMADAQCGILAGKIICRGSNMYGNLGLSDPSPASYKLQPFPVFNLYD